MNKFALNSHILYIIIFAYMYMYLDKFRHIIQHMQYICILIIFDFFITFSRLLSSSKLTSLILAGNGGINTVGTNSLLVAAKDSRTLQKLNLSACGLKSPLDTTFCDCFKTVASQNFEEGCLRELDISHNLLSVEDKERLAEEWNSSCAGESSVCLENTLFVFTK